MPIDPTESISSTSVISAYQDSRKTIHSAVSARQAASSHRLNARDNGRMEMGSVLARFMVRTRIFSQKLNSFEFSPENRVTAFRTARVSDPDKIGAAASKGAEAGNYLVGIDQLAAVKTYRSAILASGDNTKLEAGTYAFTITVGDAVYSRQISIGKNPSDPDTNRDVFRKLKWAIESTDESIEAVMTEWEKRKYSVFSGERTEKVSALIIRNRETGEAAGGGGAAPFSIKGVSTRTEGGNIVEMLTLDRSIQSGRSSGYTIDSNPSGAAANTILLDRERLSVTFLDITGDPVSIRVEKGIKPVKTKLIQLMSAYNNYVDWLDQNSQLITPHVKSRITRSIHLLEKEHPAGPAAGITPSLQRLASGLRVGAANTAGRALRAIGIEITGDARLIVTDKFLNTVERDFEIVRDVLGGKEGLFTRLKETLAQILADDPERHIVDPCRCPIYNQQGYTKIFSTLMDRTKRLSLYV